jgi:hypothetical protein
VTLTAWCETAPVTRSVWAEAEQLAGLFAGWVGPVPVATAEPVLWLAIWRAGKPGRWHPDGLTGVAGKRIDAVPPDLPSPEDPALLWQAADGWRVFSHRAVWAAILDTARLGAAGRGLPGPAALVQGCASWLEGRTFGDGVRVYPDPAVAHGYTDGRRHWVWSAHLLGVYATVDEEGRIGPGRLTRVETPGGRLKSVRLFDGWWDGKGTVPLRAEPGGWFDPGSAWRRLTE